MADNCKKILAKSTENPENVYTTRVQYKPLPVDTSMAPLTKNYNSNNNDNNNDNDNNVENNNNINNGLEKTKKKRRRGRRRKTRGYGGSRKLVEAPILNIEKNIDDNIEPGIRQIITDLERVSTSDEVIVNTNTNTSENNNIISNSNLDQHDKMEIDLVGEIQGNIKNDNENNNSNQSLIKAPYTIRNKIIQLRGVGVKKGTWKWIRAYKAARKGRSLYSKRKMSLNKLPNGYLNEDGERIPIITSLKLDFTIMQNYGCSLYKTMEKPIKRKIPLFLPQTHETTLKYAKYKKLAGRNWDKRQRSKGKEKAISVHKYLKAAGEDHILNFRDNILINNLCHAHRLMNEVKDIKPPKPIRLLLFQGLYKLWRQYMCRILFEDNLNKMQKRNINTESSGYVDDTDYFTNAPKDSLPTIAAADLIGAKLKVSSAKCPSQVGLSGYVVVEGKSSFVLAVQGQPPKKLKQLMTKCKSPKEVAENDTSKTTNEGDGDDGGDDDDNGLDLDQVMESLKSHGFGDRYNFRQNPRDPDLDIPLGLPQMTVGQNDIKKVISDRLLKLEDLTEEEWASLTVARLVTIPKKGSTFTLFIPRKPTSMADHEDETDVNSWIKTYDDDWEYELIGSRLIFRSADRSSKKFKSHSIDDIFILNIIIAYRIRLYISTFTTFHYEKEKEKKKKKKKKERSNIFLVNFQLLIKIKP